MEAINNSEKTDYNTMINYLIRTINQSKSEKLTKPHHELPIFLFEFFVFDLYISKEILKILKQPLLAFRFLDFPTQVIEGKVSEERECVIFNQGKNSYFEMEVHYLKECLIEQPLYIMLIDMNYGDMQILGSSRLNVSIFSYDNFLQYTGSSPPQPRRNILKLFDNVASKIAEFDISLLIRREYYKYDTDIYPDLQKKITIQDPHPITGDFIVRSMEELIKGDRLAISPQENKNIASQDEIMKDLNRMKLDAGVNTIENREDFYQTHQVQKKTIRSDSKNIQTHPKDCGQYANNLKELLEGKGKNPPPLFFYHETQTNIYNQPITVKIIDEREERKKIDVNEMSTQTPLPVPVPKKTNYVKIPQQRENNIQKAITNSEKNKTTCKVVSYDKKMNELLTDTKMRYENNKTKYNYFQQTENVKMQKNESATSIKYDEGNEYLNLYSRIKNDGSVDQLKQKNEEEKEKKESLGKVVQEEAHVEKVPQAD